MENFWNCRVWVLVRQGLKGTGDLRLEVNVGTGQPHGGGGH